MSCLNNLKQQGIGLNMYVGDYDFYPGLNFVAGYSFAGWKFMLAPYLGIDDLELTTPVAERKTLSSGVFRCPIFREELSTTVKIVDKNRYCTGGYGYNYNGGNGLGYNSAVAGPRKTNQVFRPALTLAIADNDDNYKNITHASACYRGDGVPGVGSRHDNGINVLWADGHASGVERQVLLLGQKTSSSATNGNYYYWSRLAK